MEAGIENKQTHSRYIITPEEKKLLNFFRNELQWGEATVTIKRGVPVFVRVALKDIKLD